MIMPFSFALEPMSFLKSPVIPKTRKETCDESSMKFLNQVLNIHLSYYSQNTVLHILSSFSLREKRHFAKQLLTFIHIALFYSSGFGSTLN